MKSKRHTFRMLATTTLVMAFSAASALHASTLSWDGSDSTAWATGTNWVGDTAPANNLITDIAQFNLATYTNQPDAGTTSVAGIRIGDGATATGALTLSGTSLTLGSNGISMLANAGAATISSPLVLGAAQSWSNTSASTLAINGAVTRNTGAAVNFVPTGTINLTGSGLADTNGILGGWATVGNAGTAGATADWAALDGSGNIVTYAGYTNISTNQTTGNATANWKTTGAITLTGNMTVNSVNMQGDVDIRNGTTLTLASGGLILGGASRWIRNNGVLSTAGTGQITSGLASGELFIDSSGSATSDADWRFYPKIVNNGGTAVTLVKNGPGYVMLGNFNSNTGGNIINGGVVALNAGGSAGTLRGALTINSGATVKLLVGDALGYSTGKVDTVNINGGTLSNAVNGNNGYATNFVLTGGTMAETVATNGTNGYNFDGANGFGITTNASATSSVVSGRLVIRSGTLGFNVADGAAATDLSVSGVILGNGGNNISKSGAGTMVLTGANTYTGTTSVNAGVLALGLNGTISNTLVLGTASPTVGSLDVTAKSSFSETNVTGNGTINIGSGKTVTVTGSLAPGFSPGTLNVTGDLALAASTSTTMELAGNGGVVGTDSDYVNVTGSLTLNGLLAIVSYGGYDLTQAASYNLFDAASFTGDFSGVSVGGNTLSFAGDIWSGTYSGTTYSFSETTGVLTVVPEPAAALLGGLGMLFLLRRRRD